MSRQAHAGARHSSGAVIVDADERATGVARPAKTHALRHRPALRLARRLLPAAASRWCWRSRSAPTRPTRRRRSSSASPSQNFALLFTDDLYLAAWLSSLRIAATATLVTLLLGYPMAYAIARAAPRRRPLLLMLVILPFWTSFLIRVYAWMGLLAENGILNQVLRWSGPGRRSRHHPGHRMGRPSRHRLRLPALHGAAALRRAGEARHQPARGGGRSRRPAVRRPSSPSPCRCRCPASSRAACWSSSRRSASS